MIYERLPLKRSFLLFSSKVALKIIHAVSPRTKKQGCVMTVSFSLKDVCV